MPVISCPKCAAKYRVARTLINRALTCSHCGTEWQAVYRRRSIWRHPLVLILIAASPFVTFFLYVVTSDGKGSPEEATRLRAVVEVIPDPEAGEGTDREYYAKRFANGEWVLGIGRDSHAILSSYRGGGTMVFKDSHGQIRCFFGHVCGPDYLKAYMGAAQSLDDFYDKLTQDNAHTEYQWP